MLIAQAVNSNYLAPPCTIKKDNKLKKRLFLTFWNNFRLKKTKVINLDLKKTFKKSCQLYLFIYLVCAVIHSILEAV